MGAPRKNVPGWVRQRYEAGENLDVLAREAGVSVRSIQRRAAEENWPRARAPLRSKVKIDSDVDPYGITPPDPERDRIARELEQAKLLIERYRREAPAQYLAIIDHLKVGLGLRLEALRGLTPIERIARPISEDKLMAEIATMVAELEDRITGFLYQPIAVPESKQVLEITITKEVIGEISSIDISDPAADILAERERPEGESTPESGGSGEPN